MSEEVTSESRLQEWAMEGYLEVKVQGSSRTKDPRKDYTWHVEVQEEARVAGTW